MWLFRLVIVYLCAEIVLPSMTEGERRTSGGTSGNGGGSSSSKISKRAKPVESEEEEEDYYYDEETEPVDERNNPTNEAPAVPPGFLSPSVREYLDLGKSIPGRPGTDYPVLGKVPYTNFYCDDQPYPGFFADVETRCQAWHYCDIDGRQATFLCPNGTQFSQVVFVCDWWFNVRCELSPKLYVINSRLYGKPTEDPTRPHRVITKELLENIFVKRK
uniref:uncharacterized protein LOC127071204 n=1 Tax=Vespula vulgaris TaxID=7454 RepID=UPI002141F9AE|nr:uncharacterized protein LOC127071204 [Vespula vulgaris]XP_050866182.1 uncharacterized protein LOC127071204 [Vespula vulgaris]